MVVAQLVFSIYAWIAIGVLVAFLWRIAYFYQKASDEPDPEWETAVVPAAVDTTFTFAGESANLPENLAPPNRAKLYVDGQPAVSFDLGVRSRTAWSEGAYAMEFTPKQVHNSLDEHDRQVFSGVSGIYRLAVPAEALRAGRCVRLKVVAEPAQAYIIHWFAVRARIDNLDVSPRTNSEQIARLQQEVIDLKRAVGFLARRSYADLLCERLPTEDCIVYEGGRAHVHEADLLLLQNGELLVAFREASEHISNDGKIVTVRSTDGGATWGERTVIREQPYTDERSASLCELRDGTILCNALPQTHYDRHGRYGGDGAVDPAYSGRAPGIYIGRSSDGGRTWSWAEKPMDQTPFTDVFTAEQIVELAPGRREAGRPRSGRLLMACYAPSLEEPDRAVSILYASDDAGATWHCLSTIGDVPGVSVEEPSLFQSRSGRLISIMRTGAGHFYYQATSDDGGETWTPARPSGIPGVNNPASVVQLADGTLLCVHGSRRDPGGLYVIASPDDGTTWDIATRRVIRDDLPNWDIGYPTTEVLPDGRVLTVYYVNLFHRFFLIGSVFRWS